ncbi:F-box/FBD/LRR-repeat protein At3g14710 [Medicago truncatula]|uniref:F-box/FBD/LRR-repeat protein At3g14710 n=1 Tax=Medicago truncatula TaxID=3880 RepID=UPI000D2F27E5|nr:F-box/FBD/LRR-repeat protein At3g14710 [Medicago truncatula]
MGSCLSTNKTVKEDIFDIKLPKSIITHILSFLPTKDAVRTSILSKSWEHRWTSLTKLSLHDHYDSSSTPKCTSFRRTCNSDKQFQRIQNFVRFVTKALVVTDGLSMQTFSLFLYSFRVDNVPAKVICFENLKHLKLCGIHFKATSPESSRYINLRFPLLTKLEAKNCGWFVDAYRVFVIAPQVQSISIENYVDLPFRHSRSYVYFTSSSDLKEFNYYGYGIPQHILMTSPCHASTKIILHERASYATHLLDSHVSLLLGQFSHAKSIKFEVLKLFNMRLESVCVFPMLAHLDVGLLSVDILLALLEKTPVLKTLGIPKFEEELLSSAVVPGSLASLHVVKFEEVNGDNHEIFLAKFFVKNVMILEKMCFSLASQIPDKDEVMEEFKEKLSSFHNFNPHVVEFSYA